jgi:outer membrane protein assembly factor BamB
VAVSPQKKSEPDEPDDAASARELDRGRKQLRRGRLTRLLEKLTGGPVRPGEQQVTRSPVVMVLVGSTIGASLLAAIFWYINGRTREERMLKDAVRFLDEQKYLDAEDKFAAFLKEYPATKSTPVATIGLHRTLVEKNIISATPDVSKGLEEFQAFIKDCGELPGFDAERPRLLQYTHRLTFAGARVAEVAQDAVALEVSRKSLELWRRYAGETGPDPTAEQQLLNLQKRAEASVARKTDFMAMLQAVEQQLASGNTLGAIASRGALIDKYPTLATDKDVVKTLQDILAREREFTTATELGRDALPDPGDSDIPALALALRTRAATDLTSQGRIITGFGIDSCFALDADTGDPVWRRAIGADTPFAPIAVRTSTGPGVLVYSTAAQQLQLLSQQDGRVVWRQSCEARPTAAPTINGDDVYLTTQLNELWQISLSTGRAIARLKFTQPVIGPPALAGGEQDLLVLPADQTLVYTIGMNPLKCVAVSHIPHRTGSVRAPMLAAGRYFLLCANDSAEKALVHTLAIDANGQLTVTATDLVDGQVNDPLMLRGSELFVPSTPQRVTAFRVTDEPNQPPLSLVGSNQLEEGVQTRMFLLAGPNNQVWLAGRDLRKFQTRTNAIELESGLTAEGIHLQPIQVLDQNAFLTTRTPVLDSVYFTRADLQQMNGIWRTVLGSRVVALAPAAGGQSLLAVADYGEAYRVPLDDIAKGGFALESTSRFRLPEKLASSVGGLVLSDGRPIAWCGAPEPAMWTFTATGQLERRWPLAAAPELPPIALANGAVFAMSGRLHLTGLSGGQAVSDYQASRSADAQAPWKSLTALSATQLLAVTDDNQFVRVEYRPAPRPQLAEVSVTKFPHEIEVAPAAGDGFVAVATIEGQLMLMQASTLEVVAQADLGGLASAPPAITGGFIFVDVANQQTLVFKLDAQLSPAGSIPLDGHALAGAPVPLPGGGFVVGRTDGLLVRLDANGAATDLRRPLGYSLQSGPTLIHDRIVVVSRDGSLTVIDPELKP